MKIKYKYIGITVIIFLLLYLFRTNIFERKFFFNELLSFGGLLSVILFNFKKNGTVKIFKENIYWLFFTFLVISLIYLSFSLLFMTNLYFYLRNSVIVYSSFSFFLGFYFFDDIKRFLDKLKTYIQSILGASVILKAKSILNYHSGSMLFALSLRKVNWKTILLMVIFNILYAINFQQSTALAITLGLLFIFIIKNFILFRLLILSGIIMFLSIVFYFSEALSHYDTPPTRFPGNVQAVIVENPLLGFDPNTTYRLIYYYRVIIENFPGNLLGRGFGTPFIDYESSGDKNWREEGSIEYEAHVSGAHNTYITIFSRLGIVGLILLMAMIYNVFREYYRHKYYHQSVENLNFFYLFFAIVFFGFLNLLLETPRFACVFWISLGFISKITHNRIHGVNK